MPQPAWNAKRKRQYLHIKDSLLEGGRPEALAEEIAARVVNKERAQHGESVQASASSINDMPASRRGGLHSHEGPGGRTLLQELLPRALSFGPVLDSTAHVPSLPSRLNPSKDG